VAGALPVVSIFGVKNIELESMVPCPRFETSKMDCRCYLTDDNATGILAHDRPAAIISFGDIGEFKQLSVMPYAQRRKWLHFDSTEDLATKGVQAFNCFIQDALNRQHKEPLVTVFTPAYKSGKRIFRPYDSLKNQLYKNWEWVIVDDSDDDGETFEMLSVLANSDPRIRLYKESRHTGVIGHIKRTACKLAEGEFLVELDHDDELTPDALERVVKAYKDNPEAGFVYSDFAECFESGAAVTYGDNWGHGFGSYRKETHWGVDYMVVNSPSINSKTIRHIVAAPNHLRSWRASTYREIGGHGDSIHVADDYELMVRTFLGTRMCRIPHMCYLQYRNEGVGNTHRERNQEIQRLVRYFSQFYDDRIHERMKELGVDDFIYEKGKSFMNLHRPNQPTESHCTIITK
jgi:glycosyltransferase involved in cell wall biosynthesis